MKAIVAVKRVLDYAARVRVKSDGTGIDLNSAKLSMNPFCEIALEAALRLKEAGHVEEVVAATVGDQAVLRNAYALGADRAIQVTTAADEPLMVAEALSALATREGAQLLILGKQAIDGDNNQTGQMCAAFLGWSQGTFASVIDIQAETKQLQIMREVDEGQQRLALSLPAVVTADLRLNTPRYASFKAVIASKKKPIETLSAVDLGLACMPQLRTVKVEEPPQRQNGRIVSSVAELVDFLETRKLL
eukprot:jgi/Ulvmu1/7525/UM037_0069.1